MTDLHEATKKQIAQVIHYASHHWYAPPGKLIRDNRHMVILPMGFRCIFVYVLKDGKLFRQITIDPPIDMRVDPQCFYVIADLFGLTGWEGGEPPEDWQLKMTEDEKYLHVSIAQEVRRS